MMLCQEVVSALLTLQDGVGDSHRGRDSSNVVYADDVRARKNRCHDGGCVAEEQRHQLHRLHPRLIIAFGTIAVLLRFVRNSMLEVMNLDFVRQQPARKGVSESTVIKRHAGRNSLNVTITVLGLTFAGFVGGFPVIESVFNLNGVGRVLAVSVEQPYDYGLIFGATLLFTFLVVSANIIVYVLYAYLDPRVRLG